MKFLTFTKPYFLIRFIACSIFFNLILFHFSNAENIKVDAEHRRIIAPFATSYQWFYEGKKIEGAYENTLTVEKSGNYSVHFTDLQGNYTEENIQIIAEGNAVRRIFLIGDSTVMTYRDDKYPMAGWGQVIQHFFDNSAFVVQNRAIGGRSSRSFIEEGRWTSVKDELRADDFLFIQWGHNDRDWTKAERWTPPADYKEYLKQYVNEARELGAIPVLISPMTLNAWRDGRLRNVFTESGSDYRGAMLEVANELDVPFVDLNMVSHALVSNVGLVYATRYLYNTYVAGEYPNYPNGLNDFTHFQEMGAIEMAKIIANGIDELKEDPRVTPLAEKLLPLYSVTIKSNNPSAGVITRNGSYPAGVTVTLKALPRNGHDLLSWKENTDEVAGTGDIFTFVMEPRERAFYALFDENTPFDCAGDFNGTATIDNCNICSGGNTQVEACLSSYQMEEACIMDGAVSDEFKGFQGTGYLTSDPTKGAAVEWILNYTAQKEVVFTFRYANGDETSRIANLVINDSDKGELEFPSTGSWSDWKTTSKTISVKNGENIFSLSALSEAGLPHLDLIALNTTILQTGDCSVLTYIPLTENHDRIMVYPNPFTDKLIFNSKEPLTYKIYDLSGRLHVNDSCSGYCEINPSLAPGLYQLIVETSQETYSTKILKE